jgi:hypothetical protein
VEKYDAEKFNIHQSVISKIKSGKAWGHIKYE